MLSNTKAIVLKTIPYSDSKRIVALYTRQEGRLSAVLQIGSKRGNLSLLEPFSVVDLTIKKGKSTLYYINSIQRHLIFNDIASDIRKRLVAVFMADVVYHTVKEEFTDDTLYDFLENSIALLNESRDEVFKFITIFLLEYGRILGFYPNIDTYTEHSLFDMKSGIFCRIPPLHKHFIEEDDTADFVRLLEARYSNPSKIEYSQQQTNRLLDIVLEFLELHVSDFKHIKSLDILRQII